MTKRSKGAEVLFSYCAIRDLLLYSKDAVVRAESLPAAPVVADLAVGDDVQWSAWGPLRRQLGPSGIRRSSSHEGRRPPGKGREEAPPLSKHPEYRQHCVASPNDWGGSACTGSRRSTAGRPVRAKPALAERCHHGTTLHRRWPQFRAASTTPTRVIPLMPLLRRVV